MRTYSKYKNKKITIDGITFDSQLEANRYCELKLLFKAGEISQLRLQPEFELIPAFRKNGKASAKLCTEPILCTLIKKQEST